MPTNLYKSGDKVRYKEDGLKGEIFEVYAIYSNSEVSLCLKDYPDHEQDFLIDISLIMPA